MIDSIRQDVPPASQRARGSAPSRSSRSRWESGPTPPSSASSRRLAATLPYKDPERLVLVFENHAANGWSKLGIDERADGRAVRPPRRHRDRTRACGMAAEAGMLHRAAGVVRVLRLSTRGSGWGCVSCG